MRSSDKQPMGQFAAETFNTDMAIIELCVDEQAHVAGGALGAIKAESGWDIALSGTSTSSGTSKAPSPTWDIALSAAEG
jgi:hypothetical protein